MRPSEPPSRSVHSCNSPSLLKRTGVWWQGQEQSLARLSCLRPLQQSHRAHLVIGSHASSQGRRPSRRLRQSLASSLLAHLAVMAAAVGHSPLMAVVATRSVLAMATFQGGLAEDQEAHQEVLGVHPTTEVTTSILTILGNQLVRLSSAVGGSAKNLRSSSSPHSRTQPTLKCG